MKSTFDVLADTRSLCATLDALEAVVNAVQDEVAANAKPIPAVDGLTPVLKLAQVKSDAIAESLDRLDMETPIVL